MTVSTRVPSGPATERIGDLAAILTSLKTGDMLFIDEIHRRSRIVEEFLYPALEDGAIDWVTGKGPGARSIRLAIKPFTLVGATTRYAMMSPPLRDRFGPVSRLVVPRVHAPPKGILPPHAGDPTSCYAQT